MVDDRKRRTDSWDASLTEAQQAQVYDRMRRFPWYAVAKWVADEFHIDPPSRAGLYRFRDWFADHESEYLLLQRIKDRDALERELAAAGATDPQALAKALGNDVVAARARGDDQAVERAIRLYTSVCKVSGGTKDLEIKLRRLELLEKKAAQAKATLEAAAGAAGKGGITPETLKAVEEALNLL